MSDRAVLYVRMDVELLGRLRAVSERTGMPMAILARVALSEMMPRLEAWTPAPPEVTP